MGNGERDKETRRQGDKESGGQGDEEFKSAFLYSFLSPLLLVTLPIPHSPFCFPLNELYFTVELTSYISPPKI
jgi:hypothetical protein